MEILGHDCIKLILFYIPQKQLVKFRTVSKWFKNTIDNLFPECSIYKACEKGYYINIINLLNKDYKRKKALYYASKGGYRDIINLFFKNDIKSLNKALFGACRNGDINMIKKFIDLGANDIHWALYHAAINGNIENIKYLISILENKSTLSGFFGACKSGNLELVKFFNNNSIFDIILG